MTIRGRAARVALVLATCTSPVAAEEPAARTTRDRIYTTEQADRGKEVYKRACSQCHALDFYKGDAIKPWEDGTLSDMYDVVANLMPKDNPASLKRKEYVDVLAYILSLNGMPAGDTELPTKAADLKAIRIKWRTK